MTMVMELAPSRLPLATSIALPEEKVYPREWRPQEVEAHLGGWVQFGAEI